MGLKERQKLIMEKGAANVTKWIGSTTSVVLHTILFVISFILPYLGVVSFERMLLFLTTIVSLEAIYLSIFIQMSINMNNQNIEIIQEDIEELGENIEELGDDIEELGEDIDELGEDIEVIQKDVDEIGEDLEVIQKDVDEIQEDISDDEEETNEELNLDRNGAEILLSIQATLLHLQKEIEQLKMAKKQ